METAKRVKCKCGALKLFHTTAAPHVIKETGCQGFKAKDVR